MAHKFDPRKLERLNDPQRLVEIPPAHIWETVDLTECRILIDLGAGTGIFSRAFLDLMGGGTIYAADTSQQMLDWITHHVQPDHPEIVPTLVQETALPFDDNSADAVILINLYHELEDPSATFAETRRVLKPGGKICNIDFKKIETEHGPPLKHRVPADEIARVVLAAGFADVQRDLTMQNHSMVWGSRPT